MTCRCRRFLPVFLVLLFPVLVRADVAPATRYAAAIKALEPFIVAEVKDKGLPALSVALIDDQQIVWARGFGQARPKERTPATAGTVYRVGSVSKLFTDVGIMQLVERGQIDLDAPVTRYLPDFKPENTSDKPITLRQLMAHRSGLVREPPVGHYFDPTNPSLADTVGSLNQTRLVYPPEKRIKYSNAAIAAVGYVLEKTQNQPFAAYLQKAVLEPLGLKRSSFELTPALEKDLAAALMWTYHGRTFEAPGFPLGMAPAGSMYSTVEDLGRFLSVLFADGKGPGGQVLKPETIQQMWTPQFASADAPTGFGIGFHIKRLAGRKCVGHGGAIYGFATELAALPEDKLGVVVVASRDVANAVTEHLASVCLGHMLAVKQDKPLPEIVRSQPLSTETVRRLAGRYRAGNRAIDLLERDGKLYWLSVRGGFLTEVRQLGTDQFILDDVVDHGLKFKIDGDALVLNERFQREPVPKPAAAPERWAGLIGEYGWDHNVLYILEKEGKLHALIEWFFLYPLEEVGENEFRFPDFGLYHDEKLIFSRDGSGRATQVVAANVLFKRRPIDGEDSTFRIRSVRPIEEIRKEAMVAQPPNEGVSFRKQELVELTTLDPTIKLDIRYAGTNNFVGVPFYQSARAFLQKPAAEALVRAHRKLKEQGYGLLIHDGYRPWFVTKMFREATPPQHHLFVADPTKGSRHNRGCAVDLTLYDLKTGEPIRMVGGYDEFSDRSYPYYVGGTSLQRWHENLLRRAMEAEDFTVYEAEWWHFDYKDWRKYPILNIPFEKLSN